MKVLFQDGRVDDVSRDDFRTKFETIPTPWGEFNSALGGGLLVGGVTTIAARPGTGKSSAVEQITEFVCESGIAEVLFWGLEMGRSGHFLRLENRFGPSVINWGVTWVDMPGSDFYRLERVLRAIDAEDEGCLKGMILVVDFIQCIQLAGMSERESLKAFCKSQNEMAADLGLSVIWVSQMNRGIESDTNSRDTPKMSDLEGCGAIEQYSDAIIMPVRPSVQTGVPVLSAKERTTFWVPKSRRGGVGKFTLAFEGATQTFWSM